MTKTTPTTAATTPQTTPQTRWHGGNHANHGKTPLTCARVNANHTATHMHSRACIACRGWRGLSDIKELQRFKRGFWRGFCISAVVFKGQA
jgi:hypothetical protein